MQNSLTQHPEGSVRELWSVSLPLMISALATLFMIFTDRIFLAHYSVDALNACANAGTLAWALMAGVGMIASMSEVFVAQYNGARQYKRLGVPVWQMVWFSFFSFAFFLPMAFWGAEAIFSANLHAGLEIQYFRWLMIFSPSYVLMMALGGFLIGRGRTRMLIWLAIIANVLNIFLDWILIFGIEGWIPALGIQGAAIATCLGYLFESVALAFFFLRKENRLSFGTNRWRLNWLEMKKCCKVGFPQGIFRSLEIFGLAVFYWMMTSLGETHITISSICQSFIILLFFFCDGLSSGAASVAGNFIGSKRYELVHKVLKAGLWLLFYFSLAIGLIFVIDPIDMIHWLFIQNPDPEWAASLKTCMAFSFAYIVLDGLRWVLSGLLVAAGDTWCLMIAGSLSVWLFLLAPVYWIVVRNHLAVEYAWGLMVLYALAFLIVYWVRFRQGAWEKIDLIKDSSQERAHSKEGKPAEPTSPTLLDPQE